MNSERTAVIYMRVSTDADSQKNSMGLQDMKCIEYAKYKGLKLRPELIFKDADVSGSTPINERPGGGEMLEALRTRKSRDLIVMKLDRLGRNAIDMQQAWLYLTAKLGVTVHIIDLGGDSFSSESMVSRLIVGMLAMFAEFEVHTIRARIKAGFDAKLAMGELLTKPPWGWDAVPTGKKNPKSGREIKMLVENPEEQKWLRRVLELRLVGDETGERWSIRRLANLLNDNKVPTKCNGNGWKWQNLHRMLNNRQITKFTKEIYGEDDTSGVPREVPEVAA